MCGCGGKRGVRRRTVNGQPRTVAPVTTVQGSVQGGISAGATPEQLRALGLQTNVGASPQRLDADKRRVEKLRREAVRKALNK
jgi:hypothetical protein